VGEAERATQLRYVRGGLWHGTVSYCRAASRSPMFSSLRGMALGFRLAKSL
jgi:formylglycine-generating enzyme required for sulfatase activity